MTHTFWPYAASEARHKINLQKCGFEFPLKQLESAVRWASEGECQAGTEEAKELWESRVLAALLAIEILYGLEETYDLRPR
jgi:hypothetical protein